MSPGFDYLDLVAASGGERPLKRERAKQLQLGGGTTGASVVTAAPENMLAG